MIKSYKIDKSSVDMRIDRWIRNYIGKIPQGLIEKDLRKGKIKLNGKKTKSSTKLKINDLIIIYNLDYKLSPDNFKNKFNPSRKILKSTESQIIENNDNFIVLNKSAGISVQGGTKSVRNLIDIYAKSKIFDNTKPYSVHRLDKDTSGILIIAKNRETAKLLTSLFRLRKIHKKYLAICNGEIDNQSGQLIHNLIKYDGKKKIIEKAISYYKILDKNNNYTFLELKPITGRKHQLRKQLYEIGHSICGDNKYRNIEYNKSINKDLMLHSYKIQFMINQKKFTFKATLPKYFENFLKTKRLNFSNF